MPYDKPKEAKTFGLRFGALSDPIKKQLSAQGLRLQPKDESLYQKIHDALILLKLHDIIPYSQVSKLEQKVVNKIGKIVVEK